MKVINVTDGMTSILLGRMGENERTMIVFDVSDWIEEYPDASYVLINRQPFSDEEYPVVISQPEDGKINWLVSGTELQVVGNGQCTLEAVEGTVVAKKHIWRTKILDAMGQSGTVPEPWENWMTEFARMAGEADASADDAAEAAEDAADAAEAAEAAQTAAENARDAAQAAAGNFQGLTAEAEGLAAGEDPTITVTHSEGGFYNFEFGIPKGDKGDKGDQGDPAPAATVTAAVDAWLDENVDPETGYVLDRTLQANNAAAPADIVGDLKNEVNEINSLDFDLLKLTQFETGSISLTTGEDSYSSVILRTGYINIETVKSISVQIVTGYKYLIAFINGSKTEVVNEPTHYTSSKKFEIADYPGAKYARFLYQKTDNTLPESEDHIHITYSTELSELLDETLKSGGVSYDTLAQDLKSTLTVKYNSEPETLTFSNTNSLLKKDGTLVSYTGSYAVTDYIDCSAWYGLKFSGRQYYDGQCLAFYDSNNNFISCFPNSTSGANNYTNQIIEKPQNAKYIRIAQYGTVVTYAYPAEEYVPAHIGAKWYGKKWVCIGDSLTEVNSVAAKRYYDYVSESTGITVVNLGVGGTGYMNGGSGSNPFRNRVADIPLDADVITIFGSFNDLGETRPLGTESDTGTDTIGGCINTTLDDIFSRITLANVGIITPTPWGSGMYPLDTETNGFNYVKLLKDICERRGIPCLDLFHCSQLRPWDSDFKAAAYSNDSTGVHPDENGHKLIAPRFEGFLDSLLFV